MNCPTCGHETVATLYGRLCPACGWAGHDYEVPADPMDELECDSCQ